MISRSTESNIDSHLSPAIRCLRKSSVLFLCCDVDNAKYVFRNGVYLLSVLRHLLSVFRPYYNKQRAVFFNILGLHIHSNTLLLTLSAALHRKTLSAPKLSVFLIVHFCTLWVASVLIGFPDVLLFVNIRPQLCQVASNGNLKFADEMQNVILMAVLIIVILSLIFPSIYIVNKPFRSAGLSIDSAESWQIVRKMNRWPKSDPTKATVKFLGQSFSRWYFHPTYQQAGKRFI